MDIFVDEDIYRPPDPDKEYQIRYFVKSTNVTILMKWILLYSEHPELLTNITELIKTNPNIINMQCSNSFAALILASYYEHDIVIRMLLDHHNTNPNLQNKYGDTALILASIKGHDIVVRMLLDHPNTNPNLQNKQGHTALIWASRNGRDIVVRMLLDHPYTNPNLQNKNGDTALSWLIWASRKGHDKLVVLLKYHIHDWNERQKMVGFHKECLDERIMYSINYHRKCVLLNNTRLSICL